MSPAGSSSAAAPSSQVQSRKVKVQDPNAGPVITATSGTQKTLLPEVRYHPSITQAAKTMSQTQKTTSQTQKIIPAVRYHPSILTQSAGDEGRPKTMSQTQRTRPDVRDPKHTDKGNQNDSNSKRVSPVSAVRPHWKNHNAPVQKPLQFPSAVPDQTSPEESIHPWVSPSKSTTPLPEEGPLGLGVHLEQGVVEEVELQTRGQRENTAWFAWRQNRITASVAHRIAHCRFVSGTSHAPPASYLAAITGEGSRVQTRAMSWGIQREEEAVRHYQVLKSQALGRSVTVRPCGLFIDAQRSWLAASPDGIVTDSRTGQWLLCLEVKCPYKHRQRRVDEACRLDPAFCLEIQEDEGGGGQPVRPPVYRLKRAHSYYTQVQVQLAVSRLQRADLVLFTLKETAIVPVTFDPELWEQTVSRLEVFYRDGLLPHLRERGHPHRTPEL